MTQGERFALADLIESVYGLRPRRLDVPITPVIDSREAQPGTVFFAFAGEHVDGHDYVDDALARGAVAVVVQRDVRPSRPCTVIDAQSADRWSADDNPATPVVLRVPDVLKALQAAARWWRARLTARVIGITGSVGKTTTKEIVARVLEQRYQVVRSQASYNNEIGLPLTLLGLTRACERVVLEMGMYVPGDIRFLSGIARPDVGIVTNVSTVHAERAGSIEQISLGKRELVEVLPPAPVGVAILNYDDVRVRAMGEHTAARCFTYGLSSQADVWADNVEGLGMEGVRARLHYRDDHISVQVPMLGRHSIFGVLRGAAAGLVEGLTWDEIIAGLQARAVQLRLVTVPGPDGSLIIDDSYNSSPPSALAALSLLEDMGRDVAGQNRSAGQNWSAGRTVAVLGDMLELGAYEREGHLQVGCRAAEVATELVVVGELGQLIGEGAMSCGMDAVHIRQAVNSEAAIEVVREVLQPGDVVLIKGSRGVKMETIVAALTAQTQPSTPRESGAR